LSRKCGSLDVSQPYGPPRPLAGIALPFFLPNRDQERQVASKTENAVGRNKDEINEENMRRETK
jgi:hypothetical protein